MSLDIIKLDQATQLLSECNTIQKAKEFRDMAEAARHYAKTHGLSIEASNNATEIKIRAEKLMGDMLRESPKNNGTKGQLNGRNSSGGVEVDTAREDTPTLADIGLTKKQSSQFQQIASIPQDIFEGHIAEIKAKEQEITTAGLLKIAKSLQKEDRIIVPNFIESTSIDLIQGDMLEVLPGLGLFDSVVTDPPYNVTNWEWDKLGTSQEFLEVTKSWLTTIKLVFKPQYNLFWFCSPQFSTDIELILRELNLPVQSRLVWHRRNMAMGSHARNKFIDTWEMIFHCGNRPLNFPQEWSDAWFDVQTFATPQTNFESDPKYHPTQKPLNLIKRLIEFGSYPNDRILDPFAGSGTTGASAAGRDCVLIERDEEYIKIIEARLNVRHRTA